MSSVRVDVQWSPAAPDQFLTWGTDLQLYQVQDAVPSEAIQPPRVRLSSHSVASLLATNNDIQYIKCVSWCPAVENDPTHQLLAVGQANGKVAITNFSKLTDPRGIKGKEFNPKHARPVNSLAWSSQEPQLLAAGLDKVRTDHSVVVCDVTRPGVAPSYSFEQRNSISGDVLKPWMEYGNAETAHSVAFSLHTARTLMAGMNNKQIRLFDLRENKMCASTNTKAVYGICTDIHNEHRFASFFESQVSIWDLRNIERPVVNLDANKPVTKLSWCPSRVGLVASLCRDSPSIRLHDILHYTGGGEDQEPAVITRSITPDASTFISAFSWHPTHENRLLTASYTGKLVDYSVQERITLNWSATSALVWTHGKKTLQQVDCTHPVYAHYDDVLTAIMMRAQKKYGLHVDNLAMNGEVAGDISLRNLWTWLDAAKGLATTGNFKLPGGVPYRYHGVWSLLTAGNLNSDVINRPWIGQEGQKQQFAKVFRSEERSRALELCSWGFENESLLGSFLAQLEAAGSHTRAAAAAVFNQRIKEAVQILQRGAVSRKSPELNSTAMALAGYTEERKALWRETCISLRSQLTDPYLRAMFAFLTDDADSFDPVLGEAEMAIQDRVAFACTYLSDVRLMDFLEKLNTRLTEEGNLDGILLTGLCSEGIDLLQRYVDLTGDVQTVALVTIHTLQHAIAKDSRLAHWVQSYRNLLDSLCLWNERAQLDVIMNENKHAERPPQHIYITCNFCKKGITPYIQAAGRPRNPYARFGTGSSNKSKMQACPNCRKPLPRCSLCLVHMGTPSGWDSSTQKTSVQEDTGEGPASASTSRRKLSHFSSWFTWCQTCRHGGHAHHLMEWFKEHSECPVTTCTCKCMSLDTVSKVASSSITVSK
ncbi:GATOR complex protein MIOS-A-like [Portunus trituberculatus]|uniref:GATOR complex protein MIOS-A-like n=1 Tax=Portunus trituberculatus TaxID=210409 RepID=UPI001E1CE921|nr:GATOR complex protein MIOS-A-like [Portunus trituberculatus]XP_045138345.1 GATOR complex protein MIOS-A-like [Portunus trituberculatus]